MTEPNIQFILSPYQNAFFHEVAEVIVHELRRGGCEAAITTPADAVLDERAVFVLLPPHEYVALEGDPWMHSHAALGRTIGLMAEQPTQSHFAQNATIAGKLAATFDFNAYAVRAYKRHGVDAKHLAFGYTDLWDCYSEHADHELDVVYLGSDEPRRQRLLATCSRALSQRAGRLVISDNNAPNHASSATFVGGAHKRRLLAGSRLLLNLHRSAEPYFEWLRFVEAFHCGTPVLSEPSLTTGSFQAGRHFVSAAPDALPYVLESLLDDHERLADIRGAAYEQLRRQPFSASLAQFVDTARGLTDRQVPASLPAFTRNRPLRHGYGTPPDEHDTTSDESVIRQSLREIRLDMQGLRRQLATLQRLMLDPHADDGPATSVVATSAAQALAADAPEISVIMALYNHSEFVAAALDSVSPGAGSLDVELVVVDDGSTDSSRDVVRQWIVDHPWVRARLVAHRVNQGLPFARNTAIAHAAGRRTFVLDADNELLPNCLPTLAAVLDQQPDAAFAYGMLEVFNPSGAIAAMNIWPWQPRRLRHGNYIDAMALIRTDVLRSLAGYTTDRRLYGWEDYELWCRIAESGGYGVQVPNFVARYRRSATSMVALSNVSHVASFAALSETCPRLFAGDFDSTEVPSAPITRQQLAPVAAR